MIVWRARIGHAGEGARIARTAKIYAGRSVSVGSNTTINDFVHIWGAGGVQIGNDCLIASHVVITSQSHSTDAVSSGQLYRETNTRAPVVIESNVWIGSNACLLPGIRIGSNAIVGAGAVVTRDVPEATLVVGVPARVVRHL